MEHWDAISQMRLALADQLADLTPEQWATPSLCGAWTVRDVTAHLVLPHVISTPAFLKALALAGGRFERANVAMSAEVAKRSDAELVSDLRRFADSRAKPPIFSSVAPLTEMLVHGQDIRIPLDLPSEPSIDRWQASLGFLMQPRARFGFAPKPVGGLRLEATDCGWTHGAGDEVRGPAAALALALLNRTALADQLAGPGAARLVGSAAT